MHLTVLQPCSETNNQREVWISKIINDNKFFGGWKWGGGVTTGVKPTERLVA